MRSSTKSLKSKPRTSSASNGSLLKKKTRLTKAALDGEQLKKLNASLVKLTAKLKDAGYDHIAALHVITEIAAEALKVDRASIWMYDERRKEMQCVDLFEMSKQQHTSGLILKAIDYPRYFRAIEKDRIIDADDVHKDMRTSEFSASYLTPLKITSMLDVPIRIGGEVRGVICHEHTGTKRIWTLEEQNFAGSMADAVSLATESNERLEVQKRLRESEERLRSLSEASNEGIVVHDKKKIIEVNMAASRIFGYTEEELIGMDPLQLAAPESRETVAKNMITGLETPYEAMGLRKDGSVFWGELAGRPFRYKGNTFRVVAIRDISRRKKAENEIELSLSIMRATLESTADGILVVDREGKITGYNRKFVEMWRIPQKVLASKDDAKAIGFVLDQLKSPDIFINKVKELYSKPENESFDVLEFKDGRVFERYSKAQFSKEEIIGRVWSFRDVTDRTRAEKEIKKLNADLESRVQDRSQEVLDLYNNSPIGYHSLDDRGNVIKVNEAGLTMLGYTREEMEGKDIIEFLHSTSKHIFKGKYTLFKKEGYIKDLELTFVRKDKSTFTASISATARRDENGNFLAARINMVDISEKKKLEEALKESELKYRTMIEAAGDVVYTTDRAGHFTYVSPRCIGLTGYQPSELEGKSFLDIVLPEWKDRVGNFYLEQFKTRKPETVFAFPITTKQGETKWVEQTVTQLRRDGKVLGHQSIVRDITQRVKAEEELKSTTTFLETILHNIPNMIFVKDAKDFRYLRFNLAAEKLIGYPTKDMVGKTSHDIFPKDQADRLAANDHEALKRNDMLDIPEELVTTAHGDRWLHTRKIPVLDSNGEAIYLIGISEDITDRKKADAKLGDAWRKEVELAKARDLLIEELKRSNKEIEQFAYIASHDLQEPLRIITNYVALLQKLNEHSTEKAGGFMHFITDAARRMQTLINDLLEYSRIGRHQAEMSTVDCNELLEFVLADMAITVNESKAQLKVHKLPTITGYPVELRSLFQNLISNAIKFRKKDVVPEIDISCKEYEKEWIFAVKDNGIGIDKKYHQRIFVIFQRLHTQSEYPGTGIGLSHCNKIVELHKGKLWVESQEGKGSTFYFSMPKNIVNEKKTDMRIVGG